MIFRNNTNTLRRLIQVNKLDWYDFTLGYLIRAHYDIIKATLTINVDVPRTIDHPKHQEAKCFEETFANISLTFKEVRYLKNIVSSNMTSDPNEDAGDTEHIVCAPAAEDFLKDLGFKDKKFNWTTEMVRKPVFRGKKSL